MRSKLLSLHLILTILDSQLPIFVDPHALIYSASSPEATPFLHASKQYLLLALSRNAVSPVPQVFEISVEIFWRMLSGLRTKLKASLDFPNAKILSLTSATERNRGLIERDFHSDSRDANLDFEAKGCPSVHDLEALSGPTGACRDLSQL